MPSRLVSASAARYRRVDWLILAAAAALHGALFFLDSHPAPRGLVGDESLYLDFARRLALDDAAALDPLWPDFYGRVLVPFLRLGSWLMPAVALAQVLCLIAAAAMLRSIARGLIGSEQVARVAWALFLLDPQVAAFAHYLWPEVLYLTLFLAVCWIFVTRSDHWPWLAIAGVLLGLACLTKSLMLPFAPLLLLALVREGGVRRGLPRAALVAVLALAIVTPTLLGNARRHGYAAIAGSSRFNLLVALVESAAPDAPWHVPGQTYRRYVLSGETFGERQDFLSRELAAQWRARGALRIVADQLRGQFFRLFDARSFLIDQLPGGRSHQSGVGYAIGPGALVTGLRWWSAAIYGLVLVAGGIGLVLLPVRRRIWLSVLWAFLIYNLLLFLALHAKSRYRIPFMPILDLAAAYGLCYGFARRSDTWIGAASVRKKCLALAVAGLLLWFAFGTPPRFGDAPAAVPELQRVP